MQKLRDDFLSGGCANVIADVLREYGKRLEPITGVEWLRWVKWKPEPPNAKSKPKTIAYPFNSDWIMWRQSRPVDFGIVPATLPRATRARTGSSGSRCSSTDLLRG